ncbi:MAG: phosphate ABC transporter permease PstA [Pseudomonadaceae bacterium]|nr:phosphate ABC transporter permease PstA [Pseudomonadaceae bacterium]
MSGRAIQTSASSVGSWFRSGDPWIWLTASAVAIALLAMLGLMALIGVRALANFWPSDVVQITYTDPSQRSATVYLGEVVERETIARSQYMEATGLTVADVGDAATFDRLLLKTGNRRIAGADFIWLYERNISALTRPVDAVVVERREWGNAYGLSDSTPQNGSSLDGLVLWLPAGGQLPVAATDVVRFWQPNAMTLTDKLTHYFGGIARFLTEYPREANTEGGVYPAIFGTVLMVMIMSVLVTPFGVLAALYLHEYAKPGPIVRFTRIAVNNLAGVPSIVYGVFGLGFFVYVIGGSIDQLFFDDRLPAPTFGTPGLLWASLTLALLTLPVVVVSTEEGLSRAPRALREGSLALGATKAETLWRVVLPVASPSILTGIILAVARAAGEVAPLMLVGVVKLAPALPVDGEFPFVHLERKFMHLGFHIYDVGFQSPNIEAAKPVLFATALLLVSIVLILNLSAYALRARLERRYRGVQQS